MKDYSDALVSVVIPVYNAKDYIVQTVNSVNNQTHSNVEVILVDDCSTDGTWDIEEKLENEYPNVHLIKNESNSGQTLSRNHGLRHISGEWFIFLDADDELYETAIEDMLHVAIDNHADIVMCDYENFFPDGKKVLNTATINDGIYSSEAIAQHLFKDIPLNVLSCVGTKLYRTEFLRKKRQTPDFPRTGGDFMFIMDSLLSDPRVYYLKKSLYKYYVRSGSISNAYRLNMYDDLCTTRKGLWELFKKFGIDETRKLDLSMLKYEIIYASLYQETYKDRSYSDFKNENDKIFSEQEACDAIECIKNNDTSKKRRFLMMMFKHPKLLYLIMKIR